MLLSRAQRPLATTSPVVRDEEAAGSNPVTPTSVSAGQRLTAAAYDLRNDFLTPAIISNRQQTPLGRADLHAPQPADLCPDLHVQHSLPPLLD
jgi:hypothetical protein